MDHAPRSESWLAGLVTPLLAFATAAVFAGPLYLPRYRSSRPPTPDVPARPRADKGFVEGLLTDDPLDLARGALARPSGEFAALPGPGALAEEIESRTRTVTQRIDVLAIMTPGGSWLENRERRIRDRHAAMSALLDGQSHQPDDPRKIGVFQADGADAAFVVPYEWFSAPASDSSVLVLWLDSSALQHRIYGATQDVLRSLLPDCERRRERVRVRVIGPTTSDELKALLDERWTAPADGPAPVKIEELLSPFATVEVDSEAVRKFEDAAHVRLRRTIGQDRAIAELLVRELALRVPALMPLEDGDVRASNPAREFVALRALARVLRFVRFVPPRRAPVRVALVAQQDSRYGRAWRDNMRRAADELARREKNARLGASHLQFELVPYLGVIDGKPFPSTVSTDDGAGRGYPVGVGQIDYLQRLESVLREGDSYAAIGILGDDVYDTLMILEALHARFPSAVFFTIDLDARFIHPDHLPYTRNIVVATHLPLGNDRQPPQFRDLYQFSLYRTLQWALDARHASAHDGAEPLRKFVGTPRLYEIGLDRAVELNTAHDLQPGAAFPSTGLSKIALNIARGIPWPSFRSALASEPSAATADESLSFDGPPWWMFAVGFALVALLVVVVSWPARQSGSRLRSARWSLGNLAACSVLASAAAALMLVRMEDQLSSRHPIEPLALFEGVSAWPATAIRVGAAVFALGALLVIPRRLRAAHERIRREFLLFAPADRRRPGVSMSWRWLIGRRAKGDDRPLRMDDVWDGIGTWTARDAWKPIRLVGYVALFHFAVGPFFALSPISSPVRGEVAYLLERFSTLVAVWSYVALVFCVLEIYFMCSRLIARVAEPGSTTVPLHCLRTEHRHTGLRASHSDRRLRMRLVASITREIEGLVYFPVIALCGMIAARASVFDWWTWPPVLVATFVLFFVLLLLCELNMRNVVQREKSRAAEFFQQQALKYAGDGDASKRIALVRTELEDLRGGAFSPVLEHSIVRSAFLPLIVYGSSQLLDPKLLSRWLSGG